MKSKQVATMVLGVALFIGAASPAVAGVEPSPFRPELGASRLQVVESYGAVVTQMVGELVEVRLDALTRSDMRALAQGTERLVCQLKAMKRLVALTGKDLLDSRLGTPSEVDRRTIVAALSTMADDASISRPISTRISALRRTTPLSHS